LERGKPVERRGRDVSKLYSTGTLDEESNVCYGEGGAGTYSDGKLYTRVGDPRVRRVMELLVDSGARSDILFVNRPHIGTDKLVKILKRMRERLVELGGEIRFDSRVEGLRIVDGGITGVTLRGGEVIDTQRVILATGHSAREVWHELERKGLPLECRPFAVGFRIEHPQTLIDLARYGQPSQKGLLPAADYSLTYNEGDSDARRGVWSFCMCPGGVVVTTPTHAGELCINGMSHASRSGRYANSAMVVSVGPEDYAREGFTGTFAGVNFQLQVEQRAFEAGGGAFVAPAARVSDFVEGRESSSLPDTSYRRGLQPANLSTLYPGSVTATLRRALGRFDRKIRGFVTEEAKLIGVETRTASPIRLPRDERGVAVGCRGLYPAGEGMGYGGGIVSAAVDGMRAAEHLLLELGATTEHDGIDPVDQRI
ncbi:MAG: FAD-dependent oxidoreductase, partial [Myxococcota bacterium]